MYYHVIFHLIEGWKVGHVPIKVPLCMYVFMGLKYSEKWFKNYRYPWPLHKERHIDSHL